VADFRPFHYRRPAMFPHKFLLALGKRLGRLFRARRGLSLDVGILCFDG
jgi:hypothetical protein